MPAVNSKYEYRVKTLKVLGLESTARLLSGPALRSQEDFTPEEAVEFSGWIDGYIGTGRTFANECAKEVTSWATKVLCLPIADNHPCANHAKSPEWAYWVKGLVPVLLNRSVESIHFPLEAVCVQRHLDFMKFLEKVFAQWTDWANRKRARPCSSSSSSSSDEDVGKVYLRRRKTFDFLTSLTISQLAVHLDSAEAIANSTCVMLNYLSKASPQLTKVHLPVATDSVMKGVATCTKVEELIFDRTKGELTDESIDALVVMTQLQTLAIPYSFSQDQIVVLLKINHNLKKLTLGQKRFTNNLERHLNFRHLANLRDEEFEAYTYGSRDSQRNLWDAIKAIHDQNSSDSLERATIVNLEEILLINNPLDNAMLAVMNAAMPKLNRLHLMWEQCSDRSEVMRSWFERLWRQPDWQFLASNLVEIHLTFPSSCHGLNLCHCPDVPFAFEHETYQVARPTEEGLKMLLHSAKSLKHLTVHGSAEESSESEVGIHAVIVESQSKLESLSIKHHKWFMLRASSPDPLSLLKKLDINFHSVWRGEDMFSMINAARILEIKEFSLAVGKLQCLDIYLCHSSPTEFEICFSLCEMAYVLKFIPNLQHLGFPLWLSEIVRGGIHDLEFLYNLSTFGENLKTLKFSFHRKTRDWDVRGPWDVTFHNINQEANEMRVRWQAILDMHGIDVKIMLNETLHCTCDRDSWEGIPDWARTSILKEFHTEGFCDCLQKFIGQGIYPIAPRSWDVEKFYAMRVKARKYYQELDEGVQPWKEL